MDDYREILSELDDIDSLLEQLEKDLEEELEDEVLGEKWVCIEHSNVMCVFINAQGEERLIGAQYIENAFTGGGDEHTDSIHTPL